MAKGQMRSNREKKKPKAGEAQTGEESQALPPGLARGQAQDVSADGIGDLDGDGGRGEFAHVARVAEMVE